MDIETLKQKMMEAKYVYDDNLITTLFVAINLGRPLLIEGEAGVGKTEVAKVVAAALDRELIRMQCYEGLDESKTLYEWNYQKQLLSIQVNMGKTDDDTLTKSLFSDEYLLERPLLQSIRSEKPVVLLIDEIDKADEEFEAFLLELLSDFQVSVPEVGTIKAKTKPFVVLTSNRARPISDALRRRCAYLYIEYPSMEKEMEILRSRVPHVDDRLCLQIVQAVQDLRNNEAILKKPSVAESLDWAEALHALGVRELTPELIRSTVGFVLKNNEDIITLNEALDAEEEEPEPTEEYAKRHEDCPHHHGDGEHCGHHHEHGEHCDHGEDCQCEHHKEEYRDGHLHTEDLEHDRH
jgi:MoxR-like ATPase